MPETSVEQIESGSAFNNFEQKNREQETSLTMMNEVNEAWKNQQPKRGGARPEGSSLEFTPLY